MLEFRILGPLAVSAAGQPVALGGAKQRALLAVLLLHRGQPLSGDRLIDLLWGERAPATAPAALRVHVANLRKALGPDVVLTERGGYLLAADAFEVDADRFTALAQDGRTALAAGDPGAARKLLGEALGLWRGEPLADMGYEQFAQSEIARLSEARMGAIEDRFEADLALGQHRSLVGEAEALVAQHPDRERLLGQLMLALYRSGRQTDALEAYRKGRLALREEFGLELSPDLRELEQRILDHDAALRPPGASSPGSGVRARRGRLLVIGGGVLLLAVAAAAASLELGGGAVSIRAAPNTVAVINARTDRVVGAVAVGARPGPVTFAAGSLWVANQDDQTVSRIDPATLTEIRALSLTGTSLAGTPTALAADGGGVWVATSGANQSFVSVGRIDPQFDIFSVTTRIGNVVPNAPVSLATGGGSVWVAPNAGDLTRLDPATGHVTSDLDPNAGPVGIAAGDGAVWLSDNQAGTVTRVDPTGLITAIPVGHGPTGIAVGDGAVWVAAAGEGKVVRIDPATRSVVATIPVGDTPTGLAFGDGSVWVANSGDGTVSRIDPAGNRVIATIAVGGSPQQVTVASGHAWVTVDRAVVSETSRPARGASARLEAARDVDTLDPAFAYTTLSWQLLYASCAKLLNYPDKPGLAGAELVPEVAQTLPTRSADGRAYTFTIRPGFRFSPPSDQVVTAQTFKYTIMRTLDPRMKNPAASEFDDIVGARAFIAGKATAIAGVTTSGDRLTIRLTAPAPDLPARLAQPFFCAVPIGTPLDPNGIRAIPMAGPYEIASYAPGQGIVLVRNPNYHGDRPHSLERIEVRVNVPGVTAITRVERGTADYAVDGEVDASDAGELAARYGAGSRPARAGRQQYFVNSQRELDFLNLNTHRPLFADARMRLAANYAIDRSALAELGGFATPLPDQPAESYLPPGVPGYTALRPYPSPPNLAKARALALGHRGQTAVLYVCEGSPCDQQGEVIKRDLEAIGLRVEVKAFPLSAYFAKQASGESYDLSWVGWAADYPDPEAILNLLLETPTQLPTFNDSGYRARLAAAAELSGPKRFLAYAKLDADLVGRAAPWVAYGNASSHDFFSARIGCQTYGVYGIDIAALCLRTRRAS